MTDFERPKLLVVDDEEYICTIIKDSLSNEKYDVVTFVEPMQAIEHINNNPVDLVLTDMLMGEHSGDEVVDAALENHDDVIVILMTAHPTVKSAISILRRGAYDFLVKPFKLELLKATISRGLEHQRIFRENINLKGQVEFLKTATVATPQHDLDEYLQLVLESCKTELNAHAANIICYDPDSGVITNKVVHNNDHQFNILNHDELLEPFFGKKRIKPIIKFEKVNDQDIDKFEIQITKPIVVGSKSHGLINLLIHSRFKRINQGKLDVLSILANSAASAIANRNLHLQNQASYFEAIHGLANAIEARDPYTAGHTDRVSKLAERVAIELGWDDDKITHLAMGCTLHDIGKIGVPDSILNKTDPFTEDEREKMMHHPMLGLKIVQDISLFKPAIPYISAHHERYDGNGYPKGLKGKQIPIEGRLLSVVDTFDAIISDRPYRAGAPLSVAVNELLKNKGKQLDPEIVDLFISLLKSDKLNLSKIYKREIDISCVRDLESTETETEKASVSETPAV